MISKSSRGQTREVLASFKEQTAGDSFLGNTNPYSIPEFRSILQYNTCGVNNFASTVERERKVIKEENAKLLALLRATTFLIGIRKKLRLFRFERSNLSTSKVTLDGYCSKVFMVSCCAIQIRPTYVSINFLSPARKQPLIANCQTVFLDRYRLAQAVFSQEYHHNISALLLLISYKILYKKIRWNVCGSF